MTRHYVNVSHLSEAEMAFFGFRKMAENDDFIIYRAKGGDDHIVDKKSPHVFVDDINDAIQMKAAHGITIT